MNIVLVVLIVGAFGGFIVWLIREHRNGWLGSDPSPEEIRQYFK